MVTKINSAAYRDWLFQSTSPSGTSAGVKHGLAFAVVCDPGNVIARRLGILTQPSRRPEPPSFSWDWT